MINGFLKKYLISKHSSLHTNIPIFLEWMTKMNNDVKLEMCGCGGKPMFDITSKTDGDETITRYFVYCKKCLSTISGKSYEEAVEKWNRAMSGNRVRIHKVVFDEDNKPVKPWRTDEDSKRWHCGACSTAVGRFWVYCQKCGTPIDWSVRNENA